MSFLDLPIISILFKNGRSISSIEGFITLSENTRDDLEITQQPVQQGSTISDHAFKKPTILSMQIQFSNSDPTAANAATLGGVVGGLVGPLGGAIGGAAGAAIFGNGDQLSQTYQDLLDLQSSLEPFDIATPKRIYKSMLFQSLGLTTDKRTEKVLSITAGFQQVKIVTISTAIIAKILQKQPGRTQKTAQAGKKSGALVGTQAIIPGVQGFRG